LTPDVFHRGERAAPRERGACGDVDRDLLIGRPFAVDAWKRDSSSRISVDGVPG